MGDDVRATLVRIVTDYGRDVASDAKRCEGLLRDLCPPDRRREVNVLVAAVREKTLADLLAMDGAPIGVVIGRAANRLHDSAGIALDLARWSIESWAIALDAVAADSLPPSPSVSVNPAPTPDSSTPPDPPRASSRRGLEVDLEPPQEEYEEPSKLRYPARSRVRAALHTPALVMIIFGLLMAVFLALAIIMMMLTAGANKDTGTSTGVILVYVVWMLLQLTSAYAGYCMMDLQRYRLVFIMSILNVIPFCGCFPVSLLPGIWTLIAIKKPGVEAAFHS